MFRTPDRARSRRACNSFLEACVGAVEGKRDRDRPAAEDCKHGGVHSRSAAPSTLLLLARETETPPEDGDRGGAAHHHAPLHGFPRPRRDTESAPPGQERHQRGGGAPDERKPGARVWLRADGERARPRRGLERRGGKQRAHWDRGV